MEQMEPSRPQTSGVGPAADPSPALRGRTGTAAPPAGRRSWRDVVAELAQLPSFRTVQAIAIAVLALAMFGAVDSLVVEIPVLDPTRELANVPWNIPVLFSAAILIVAGAAAAGCAAAAPDRRRRLILGAFAVAFTFLAFDETLSIHEALEGEIGNAWLLVYAVPGAIGAGIWLAVLRSLVDRPERWLWLGGTATWVVAQTLDRITYGTFEDESVPGTAALVAAEEILEMIGTALLIWALLAIYVRYRDSQAQVSVSAA